jgi:CRP-like cAMP-binding protein
MIDRQTASRPTNHLLATLSPSDFKLVQPTLVEVDLPTRYELENQGKSIKHIYFPLNGIASVVVTSGRQEIEAGIIGYEGMSGLAVVMANDRSPHQCYAQVAGTGLRMTADELREAMGQSATLQDSLLHFAHAFTIQTAHTSLANGRATIDERLARWLLMAHDRIAGDEITLTHDFLGLMLGVRRAGVTEAVQKLEAQALIVAGRGKIVVVGRPGLIEVANGFYGLAEVEYRRLTGWKTLH